MPNKCIYKIHPISVRQIDLNHIFKTILPTHSSNLLYSMHKQINDRPLVFLPHPPVELSQVWENCFLQISTYPSVGQSVSQIMFQLLHLLSFASLSKTVFQQKLPQVLNSGFKIRRNWSYRNQHWKVELNWKRNAQWEIVQGATSALISYYGFCESVENRFPGFLQMFRYIFPTGAL